MATEPKKPDPNQAPGMPPPAHPGKPGEPLAYPPPQHAPEPEKDEDDDDEKKKRR